jgi:hypothetical protein
MYSEPSAPSSAFYDFRKDFSAIVAPGMQRFLQSVDAPPADGDWTNLRWYPAKRYVRGLWNDLKIVQRDYRSCAKSGDFEVYDIKDWTPESVRSYVDQRLEEITEICDRTYPPFGADHFIESEIGVFGDKRSLLERVGALEDARKLVHRMRAEGAFDVAIERAVQLLFLNAIKTAPPKRAAKESKKSIRLRQLQDF